MLSINYLSFTPSLCHALTSMWSAGTVPVISETARAASTVIPPLAAPSLIINYSPALLSVELHGGIFILIIKPIRLEVSSQFSLDGFVGHAIDDALIWI